MAKTDPRQEGHDAAVAGADRRSPYDGRTEAGKAWYAGYDSHEPAAAEGGLKLADTPFDASSTSGDQSAADAEQVPAPDDEQKTDDEQATDDESEKPAEESGELASVGASTDPDIQFLAANRQSHQMVVDDEGADAASKRSARSAITSIDNELRRRGYRA